MPAPKKFAQTISDLYNGAKIEDILKAGWIVNSQGVPLQNSGDEEKNIDKIFDFVSKQKDNSKVYFTHVPQKDSPVEQTFTLKESGEDYKPEKSDTNVVDINVKSETLLQLADVYEYLQKYNGKNVQMNSLKDNCKSTIEKLTKAIDKDEFKDILDKFATDADEYYFQHASANLNKRQVKNTSVSYRIKNIRDAVNEDKVPEQPDKIKELQARVAAKYVSAYCHHTMEKDAKEENKTKAKELLEDPEKFKKAVEKAQKDSAFLYMYGSRVAGDEKDVLARLNEGLTSKAAGVLKNVEKERQFPTKARQEIDVLRRNAPPKRLDGVQQYSSMSLEEQKPIAQTVKSLREELEAIGGSDTSSPEFAKLKHELLVADLRLSRQNPTMDVKKEMAELGDAVDEYLSKRAMDGKLNERGSKRANVANRLRNLCDAVAENKKPEEAVPNKEESAKQLLAERLAKHVAKEMMKSDDPRIAKEGVTMSLNKIATDKAVKQILNSDSFKEMFNDPKKVENALGKKPEDIYAKLGMAEFKKAGPEAQNEVNKFKEEILEVKDKVEDIKIAQSEDEKNPVLSTEEKNQSVPVL